MKTKPFPRPAIEIAYHKAQKDCDKNKLRPAKTAPVFALVARAVHSVSISEGTALEKILAEHCGELTDQKETALSTYFWGKGTKKQFNTFGIKTQKGQCLPDVIRKSLGKDQDNCEMLIDLIQIKVNGQIDYSKRAGETAALLSNKSIIENINPNIRVRVFMCAFDTQSNEEASRLLSSEVDLEKKITYLDGKGLCELLHVNYDKVMDERATFRGCPTKNDAYLMQQAVKEFEKKYGKEALLACVEKTG